MNRAIVHTSSWGGSDLGDSQAAVFLMLAMQTALSEGSERSSSCCIHGFAAAGGRAACSPSDGVLTGGSRERGAAPEAMAPALLGMSTAAALASHPVYTCEILRDSGSLSVVDFGHEPQAQLFFWMTLPESWQEPAGGSGRAPESAGDFFSSSLCR